jgi:hypothetical protein
LKVNERPIEASLRCGTVLPPDHWPMQVPINRDYPLTTTAA